MARRGGDDEFVAESALSGAGSRESRYSALPQFDSAPVPVGVKPRRRGPKPLREVVAENARRPPFVLGVLVLVAGAVLVAWTVARGKAPYEAHADNALTMLFDNDHLPTESVGWVGSDVGTSVRLGEGRYLWLWGDSLVGKLTADGARNLDGGGFPRSTVAVLTGGYGGVADADFPQAAAMFPVPTRENASFSWSTDAAGKPTALFRPRDFNAHSHWYWAVSGTSHAGQLFVFAQENRNVSTGLGFQGTGTGCVRVSNPNDHPTNWSMTAVQMLDDPDGKLDWSDSVAWGQGSDDKDYLYFMGHSDYSGSRQAVLSRLHGDHLAGLRFNEMQYWVSGAGGPHWTNGTLTQEIKQSLQPLADIGGEATLQWHPYMRKWFRMYVNGFGGTSIDIWTATSLTGTWTKEALYNIPAPYNNNKRVMCYAVKSHPEFTTAENEIVFTYATNGVDLFKDVLAAGQEHVYIPRFVRVRLASSAIAPST